jgi:hypothetical protein
MEDIKQNKIKFLEMNPTTFKMLNAVGQIKYRLCVAYNRKLMSSKT